MSADDKVKTTDEILKMLKEAGVSAESLVDKSHAFWDTQVSFIAPDEQFVFPVKCLEPYSYSTILLFFALNK